MFGASSLVVESINRVTWWQISRDGENCVPLYFLLE